MFSPYITSSKFLPDLPALEKGQSKNSFMHSKDALKTFNAQEFQEALKNDDSKRVSIMLSHRSDISEEHEYQVKSIIDAKLQTFEQSMVAKMNQMKSRKLTPHAPSKKQLQLKQTLGEIRQTVRETHERMKSRPKAQFDYGYVDLMIEKKSMSKKQVEQIVYPMLQEHQQRQIKGMTEQQVTAIIKVYIQNTFQQLKQVIPQANSYDDRIKSLITDQGLAMSTVQYEIDRSIQEL